MTRPTFWTQVEAFLWRNAILKKRHALQTAIEFLLPVLMTFNIVYQEKPEDIDVASFIPKNNIHPFYHKPIVLNKNICVQANTQSVHMVSDAVTKILSKSIRQNFTTLVLNSSLDMNEYFYEDNCTVGITFDEALNGVYKIYVKEGTVPNLNSRFSKSDEFFETSSSVGIRCPSLLYYINIFSMVQLAADSALLQFWSGQNDLQVPDAKFSIYVTETSGGQAVIIWKTVASLVLVVSFTPFVSLLSMLIVQEKERKIKETMFIMGLRPTVYWFSWFITGFVTICFVTVLQTIMFSVYEIFNGACLLAVFLIELFFGLSMITFTFMITPFLRNSKVAASASSIGVILLSLFYFLYIFVSKKIPSFIFYFMSLLSPTAFTLGITKLRELELKKRSSYDIFFDGSFSVGSIVLMLFIDTLLYGLLAYYFDNVIPGEFGRKRQPLFFLPFLYNGSISPKQKETDECSFNMEELISADEEPVSQELQSKEYIKIENLRKVYDGYKTEKTVAVHDVSLSIYEDQITALLGRNGAGKTTLIGTLCGSIEPTSGNVTVNGNSIQIHENLQKLRSVIGFCPQDNVIFDNVTPYEHLFFFGWFKGLSKDELHSAVCKILDEVDLADSKNTKASELSGGQKRKLCVGLALIGNPKIIFLDEPSSGLDPLSRQKLWAVLRSYKEGRVILLTTHFMDEADILADRKVIIHEGKLRCVGSSIFLKQKFGIGYQLRMILDDSNKLSVIKSLIQEHYTTDIPIHESKNEIFFNLPSTEPSKFIGMLESLENASNDQNLIPYYGVTMPTLEDIFLKLTECNEDIGKHKEIKEREEELEAAMAQGNGICSASSHTQLRSISFFLWINFLKTRLLLFIRNPANTISIIAIPVLIMAILKLSIPSTNETGKLLRFSPNIYEEKILCIENMTGERLNIIEDTVLSYGLIPVFAKSCRDFKNKSYISVAIKSKFSNNSFDWEWRFDIKYTHALPILQNIMSNIFWNVSNHGMAKDKMLKLSVQEVPSEDSSFVFNVSLMIRAALTAVVITIIAAPITLEIIDEKKGGMKNHLHVSGMSFLMYWSCIIASQLILYAITVTLIIAITFPIFNNDAVANIIIYSIFYLTLPSLLLFCNVLHYIFNSSEVAGMVTPFICTWVPILLLIISVNFEKTSAHPLVINALGSLLFPFYIPVVAAVYVTRNILMTQLGSESATTLSYYLKWESTVPLCFIGIIGSFIIYSFLLWVVDNVSSFGGLINFWQYLNKRSSTEKENCDIPEEEDDDVKKERNDIIHSKQTPNDKETVLIFDRLRKVFKTLNLIPWKKSTPPYVAVRNLSLCVKPGEILGLLGPNGAGKTTTIRITIAAETPTTGSVTIGNQKVISFIRGSKNIGYCPQHDTLWKTLTVQEHISLYAALRGVHIDDPSIDSIIDWLDLKDDMKKKVRELSGGTKRKLSYVLSVLGRPKLQILDEPSTSMDPRSKRSLWTIIQKSFTPGSKNSVFVTTHSMQEAEVLCTRIGIMMQGVMRCLGPVQYLKNKYGEGYELQIKLSENDESDYSEQLRKIESIIENLPPYCSKHEDNVSNIVTYSFVQKEITSLAHIFQCLEEAKISVGFESYYFSQTTLEQVFLGFVKQQKKTIIKRI